MPFTLLEKMDTRDERMLSHTSIGGLARLFKLKQRRNGEVMVGLGDFVCALSNPIINSIGINRIVFDDSQSGSRNRYSIDKMACLPSLTNHWIYSKKFLFSA